MVYAVFDCDNCKYNIDQIESYIFQKLNLNGSIRNVTEYNKNEYYEGDLILISKIIKNIIDDNKNTYISNDFNFSKSLDLPKNYCMVIKELDKNKYEISIWDKCYNTMLYGIDLSKIKYIFHCGHILDEANKICGIYDSSLNDVKKKVDNLIKSNINECENKELNIDNQIEYQLLDISNILNKHQYIFRHIDNEYYVYDFEQRIRYEIDPNIYSTKNEQLSINNTTTIHINIFDINNSDIKIIDKILGMYFINKKNMKKKFKKYLKYILFDLSTYNEDNKYVLNTDPDVVYNNIIRHFYIIITKANPNKIKISKPDRACYENHDTSYEGNYSNVEKMVNTIKFTNELKKFVHPKFFDIDTDCYFHKCVSRNYSSNTNFNIKDLLYKSYSLLPYLIKWIISE